MKKVALVVAAALLAVVSVVLAWVAFTERPPVLPIAAGRPATPPEVATAATNAAVDRAASGDDAVATRTNVEAAAASRVDAEREPSGELLVTVVWADGTPAAEVQVYVAAKGGGGRALATFRTDDAGGGRTRVPAGTVSVTTDRSPQGVDGNVVAGASCEVRVELKAGVDVAGVVRDAKGDLVAGAQIWLTSFQAPWRAMAAVAKSDAQGQFAVRGAPKEQSLGATAAGHGPSALVDLEALDTKQPPVRVDLVMAAAGGSLAGRVVDDTGKGVAGALVAVGRCDRLIDDGIDGRMREKWAPMRSRTDAAGDYRCDGLAPGEHPVEVWTPAFPFWHGKVTIEADTAARLDIALPRGVTVHGTVTGEGEAPLGGAIVRAFPVPIDESFLMTGQYDYDSAFGNPSVVADEAGRYRLTGVAPGEVQLYAGPGGRRREFGNVVPWAHAVVQATSGAVLEWNAKVEPGPTIHGVVRFRDGAPMAHSFVNVTVPGEKRGKAVVTDKTGRFRFIRLAQRGHDVSVQVWDPPKGAPPLEARDVWPDRGELVLTASYDAPRKLAKGTVRGAVVDSAGRAANAAAIRVLLANDNRSWNTHGALVDGKFRFADVEPGQKRLIVMYEDAPIHVGEAFELQPAEDKDFGVITTLPGGKLTLLVERGPGTENVEPVVYLRPAGSMHARKVDLGKATQLVVDNLCLGEHIVSSWHQGIAPIRTTCRVVAGDGDGTPLRLSLRAAALREVVVEYTAEQRITGMRVEDEHGAELWNYPLDRLVDRPYRQKLQLPLGKCVCRVETAGGGVTRVDFTMTSLDANQPPIVVQLK